jgi:hypothetical protein
MHSGVGILDPIQYKPFHFCRRIDEEAACALGHDAADVGIFVLTLLVEQLLQFPKICFQGLGLGKDELLDSQQVEVLLLGLGRLDHLEDLLEEIRGTTSGDVAKGDGRCFAYLLLWV